MEQPSNTSVIGEIQLQSQDHRDLLDIVDKLKSQGIRHYVDLPQIIVCGDQSSGKSSVLEAISGMTFPTKDNLCTRFATELILRRDSTAGVNVRINAGQERSEEDKKKLDDFKYARDELDLAQVVDEAKIVMGLSGNDKVFSTDILCVEISGPTQPHLTMVDLPGLFLAGNKDQSEEDARMVEGLVLSYMRRPRSIILAVVSAKSDFALQQVTRLARDLDPNGERTLGLITKPDTLDEGSESENSYLHLARNEDVKFRLGWHVVRNRNYAERNTTNDERDRAESEFFSKGVWTSLNAKQLGIETLRKRLSKVLRDQILRQLPSVLDELQSGIHECKQRLLRLGASRATLSEQRRYLLRAGSEYSSLLKAAIDGVYEHVFFKGPVPALAYRKRLRAVVQNALSAFAEDMHREGHAKIIIDLPPFEDHGSRHVSRSTYLEEVKETMKMGRGRELPGTYNPLIVAELFSAQCQPWKSLVNKLADVVFESSYTTVIDAIQYVTDDKTAVSLLREIVGPSMEALKGRLSEKVKEMLEPHLLGHPITYNHYLTDNVQKAQAERHRRKLEEGLKAFFGAKAYKNNEMQILDCKPQSLLKELVSYTEPNMDKYSCSMATDMMEAYYKVALKNIIDDIGVLAVERCLIQQLPALLSPDVVCELADADVQRIAGESQESASDRYEAVKKLEVLEKGMAELKRLQKHSPSLPRNEDLGNPGSASATASPSPQEALSEDDPGAQNTNPDALEMYGSRGVESKALEPERTPHELDWDWARPKNSRKKRY